jgi:plastocyanin domain-containing protein
MMKNGMQMIDISIKDGTYTPNRFTAKKGMPIEVMFTVVGKPAGDCLANPTFKSLDKTVHITMGSKALKLGTLAAGTYQFGCAMGMNTGDIVVQ